ncbi:MAG TPA: hypothetical protein VM261_21285 [Kofleriaceae bacterium]|nr:hypothetical protein [Kofleriaceae bacterium]
MRFCPFCTAENVADATTCVQCGRRLPPPPTRKRPPGAAPVPAAPVSSTAVTAPTPSTSVDDEKRALRAGLLPPPTAVRRKGLTGEVRPTGGESRRKDDATAVGGPGGDDTRTRVDAQPQGMRAPPMEATRPIDASWIIEGEDPNDPVAPPPPPSTPPPSTPPPVYDGPIATSGQIGDDTSAKTLVASAAARTPSSTQARLAPLDSTQARRKPTTMPPPVPTVLTSPATGPTPMPPKLPPTPIATPSSVKIAGRDATALNPPPTRILRDEALADRPFTPPAVIAIPTIPDPGLVNVARYAITFGRARWQRRRAVKLLHVEIKSDTDALDGVLLQLGRDARGLGVENRVLSAENQAITDAEKRRDQAVQSGVEIGNRKLEETQKYEELERERTIKVTDAERVLEEAQRELSTLEAQRRGLRDKRKELERRQSAYVKAAEQRDTEAGNAPLGETRGELRRLADGHRREAASLDPERQDLERRLSALERPITYAQTKVEQAKAEVDQQRRSLADLREGHRHRLAELDAESSRKSREKDLVEGEINRRLVNLGTLINLHRVERPEFAELYGRIDRLRHAINARTTEIDRLTAEREAYDRGSLLRGYAVLGGVAVLLITFVVIILALV